MNKNSNDMEDKIFKILRDNKVGHHKAHYIKNELLLLFGVSDSFTADDVERAYDDGYKTEGEITFDIENYR